VVTQFLDEKCITGHKLRIKKVDIQKACVKYIKDHQLRVQITRVSFYAKYQELHSNY